jgi:hypothetical protein
VLWSAWEDELTHALTRAEARRARRRTDTFRADERVGRRGSTPELEERLDAFTADDFTAGPVTARGRVTTGPVTIDPDLVHATLAGWCRRPRPHRAQKVKDGDPPF